MNRGWLAGLGCDRFCFHVSGLPEVSEAALLHAAAAGYVGNDLDFASAGKGLDAVVELGGNCAELDVQGSR
jgi:hypothetical protein